MPFVLADSEELAVRAERDAGHPLVNGIERISVSESPRGACRSQSLTVLSQLAEARVRLSEEKATPTDIPAVAAQGIAESVAITSA